MRVSGVMGINRFADVGDFDGVCDQVTRGKKTREIGDSIGWAERLAMYKIGLQVLP